MLVVYVDETGDPSGAVAQGGSREYALGVLVIEVTKWRAALDAFIDLRRSIRTATGVPMTAEIKASYLVRNDGWFKGGQVRPSMKQRIVRDHLRLVSSIGGEAFSVWVDKSGSTPLVDVKATLWDMLFQRIQKTYPTEPFLLVHDEGDELYIRKHARRARRFLTAGLVTGGSTRLDAELLMDDPVSRVSSDSYFVQCADLIAYSAAKAMIRGGSRADRVFPQTMWNELGSACKAVVNHYARSLDPSLPAGIAVKR